MTRALRRPASTQRVIDKISRYAPNFEDIQIRHITFAPYHMNTMFGAPAGDFCHGLLHPDLMGPNHLGPKGFRDLPIGIDGLYISPAPATSAAAAATAAPRHHLHPGIQRRVPGARRPRLTRRSVTPRERRSLCPRRRDGHTCSYNREQPLSRRYR